MKKNLGLIILAVMTVNMGEALGQDLDSAGVEAKKLLERISSTKVPGDNPLVIAMAARIRAGDYRGAAEIATGHPEFLNTTVKLMALKMSTREESFRQPLNDFAASVIGVTRDGLDARTLLSGDFYYRANPLLVSPEIAPDDMVKDIISSNKHYADLEKSNLKLGDVLIKVDGQKLEDNAEQIVASPDPAGVLTSRTFLGAHAVDGTNRRLVEFAFREFMCVPIEEWSDTSASDVRIGPDIDRFPGGDHMKFQTTCKGCHTQMDGFRGAFAKWDFPRNKATNGALTNRGGGFNAQGVSNKMNDNNTVFSGGYMTTGNTFINNSRMPANATLFGWRGKVDGGVGAKELGTMIANSKRFSQCMVKRVYDAVCRTDLDTKKNISFLSQFGERFEQGNYNLKKLFQEIAVSNQCLGK